MRYAVVRLSDNVVTNMINWDGESAWQPPEGHEAIQSDLAEIGWIRQEDDSFVAPEPIIPVPTEQDYANAVQRHIDSIARSKNYSDGVSLASYVSSTISTWATEAATFIAWRDSVWSYVFQVQQQVQQEIRPAPTIEELISELPVISW